METLTCHIMNIIMQSCNDYIPLIASVVIIGLVSIPLADLLLPRHMVDEGVLVVFRKVMLMNVFKLLIQQIM
jgi:hypothetical protein